MNESDLETKATELKALYEEDSGRPFPYEGSRKLLQAGGGNYESFIPDLSLHFSTVAGYCSWGKRILRWEAAKIDEVKEGLEKQFFDRYPEYKPLEMMIAEQDNADLLAKFCLHEKMRIELQGLLENLQRLRTH